MTPPARTAKPAWAAAFKRRREEAVGSQEEMAIRADISQSLVSQIERGVQNPVGMSVERFTRILNALNWSPREFSEATGLDVSGAIADSAPMPVLSKAERPLPEGLQDAIDQFGDEIKAFRDPSIVEQLRGARHLDGGPRTAEDWREYYLDMRRWLHRK